MNEQIPPIVEEEPKKKNNTVLIIAIVVVVLLCCCCLIIAIGWQFGDCLTNPNDPSVCPLASTVMNLI